MHDNMRKFLLTLWQLPQCLVAWIMWLFLGEKKLIREENGCKIYEAENMSGGISLGTYIFLDKVLAKREESIRHELGHVKQSHMLGWLYLIIIGIPSILWAIFHGKRCYYSFYTESWANELMNLKVKATKHCCYIYIEE